MKKSGSRLIYAVFAALVYGLGSAISVGSLLSPAGLYTGGVTGLAQLLSALSGRLLPDGIPIYFLILAINIPLDRLLLETDAPYLTPVPFRGKENQPAYTKYVAEEIAKLRNITVDEINKATTQNTFEVFGI